MVQVEATGPVPRREPRSEKAQEILNAARAEFVARGYAAARLNDIAARAGVAKGTLYLYFQSKEDLFHSLVRTAISPNLSQLQALAEDCEGPVAPLIERFAQVALGVVGNEELVAIPRLVMVEAHRFPDLAQFYYREVARRGLDLLTQVIATGVERGEFRPVEPAEVARLVIAPFLLHAIWRSVFGPFDDRPVDAAALARVHIDTLLNGLRVRPGSTT